MTDEALRALERAAAADPLRTLEWTRALERAGRGDEAWLALCKAIGQPDVRNELATRPAWTHAWGPGGCRALDVPPVRRAPRVRWRARVGVDHPRLLASPLGVVSSGRRSLDERLDPRDGRLVAPGVHGVTNPWLDGGLLLAEGLGSTSELHAWDLVSGREAPHVERLRTRDWPWLHRLQAPPAPEREPLLADGRPWSFPPEHLGTELPTSRLDGGAGHVITWPPIQQPATLVTTPSGFDASLASGWLVLTIQRARSSEVFGYDLQRDALVWRADGWAVAHDASGALIRQPQAGVDRSVVLDHDGTQRWAVEDLWPVALGAEVVAASTTLDVSTDPMPYPQVVLLDRATGARRSTIAPLRGRPVHDPVTTLIRDLALVAWDGVVQAHTLDGAHLWSFDVAAAVGLGEGEGWITDVAPLPGALLVAGRGHVVCLEEAP